MLEKDIRKWVVDRWKSTVRITRIESPGTKRSIPDLQLRSNTADWWVEIKRYEKDPTYIFTLYTIIDIPWRPGQLSWLKAHAIKDGNVALIFCIRDYFYIIQDISNILVSYRNIQHLDNCSDYSGYIYDLPDDVWEKGVDDLLNAYRQLFSGNTSFYGVHKLQSK